MSQQRADVAGMDVMHVSLHLLHIRDHSVNSQKTPDKCFIGKKINPISGFTRTCPVPAENTEDSLLLKKMT